MIKTIVDKRLKPVRDIVLFAFRALEKNDSLTVVEIIPPANLPFLDQREAIRKILQEYRVIKQTNRHSFWEKGSATRETLVDDFRALNLVLWIMTSKGFSFEKVYESKELLAGWIDQYGLSPKALEGHRQALKFLGIVKKYKGGLVLDDSKRVEVTPGKISTDIDQPTAVRSEKELYPFVRDFFINSRSLIEGYDFTGWANIEISAKANRKDQVGDWGNPDLFGYRIDHDLRTQSYSREALAVEVKRIEIQKKQIIHFKKSWIAQAKAYHRIANIVYLAVNTTIEAILQRPIVLRMLLDSKVGLLLLRNKNDLESWYEVIPPSFVHPRPASIKSMIDHVFKNESFQEERIEM